MKNSRDPHRVARARNLRSKLPAVGVAGIAAAGAAVLVLSPTLAISPVLMATVHYLPATRYGDFRPEAQYEAFADVMIAGSGVTGGTKDYVDYPASFWPLSFGGLSDRTFDNSVNAGLANLEDAHPADGDVIFGYSQGAVVASKYKASDPNTNITYVLVENPNRPNGGILERFNGLHIPILDVSFDGATADNGAPTVDISRQYDGWSDFPTYPLNVLATANAIAGIVYLHSPTQNFTDPAVLTDIKADGNPMYYQEHGSTTYYVIPSTQLPILMPFRGIIPAPILDALDPPLRAIIESGYDRTDYSTPTSMKLIPGVAVATPSAVAPRNTRPARVVSPAAADATARAALPTPIRAALKALAPKKTGTAKPNRSDKADTAKD
ncbi:hypothetical protein BH09ACT8_BH09ACT8_31290 [soil metagenome]